jgi:hypothetical protein
MSHEVVCPIVHHPTGVVEIRLPSSAAGDAMTILLPSSAAGDAMTILSIRAISETEALLEVEDRP